MERSERIGLGVAAAGHVLLFALLSSQWLRAPVPQKLNNPPMNVTLSGPIKMESTAPKLAPTPPPQARAPEKGPQEEAKPTPAPAPVPKAAPKPQPKPVPPKPTPPKPTPPAKVAAPAPKPVPKPAPAKQAKPAPKTKPAPARTAAAPAAPAKTKASAPAKQAATATGKGSGQRNRASGLGADFLKGQLEGSPTTTPQKSPGTPAAKMGPAQARALNEELSRQIYPHLNLPSGIDVELLVASLDVRLNRNGSVAGRPTVTGVTGVNESNRPQVELYKERAIQAVLAASPFKNLPVEYYEEWKWLSPLRIYARKAQ